MTYLLYYSLGILLTALFGFYLYRKDGCKPEDFDPEAYQAIFASSVLWPLLPLLLLWVYVGIWFKGFLDFLVQER